jgi:hypothetical protein
MVRITGLFGHLLRHSVWVSRESGMLRIVTALWMIGAAILGYSQSIPDEAHPTAACGNDKTAFVVSRGQVGDKSAADTGKATVYFVELYNLLDKGRVNRPTIRQGLDGKWLGATQGFTYLSASVDPGTHHICSQWQSRFGRLSDQVSLNNFEAEAGKRYYFRVQISVEGAPNGEGAVSIDLQRVSEDEGRFLVSEAAQSVSKPKT